MAGHVSVTQCPNCGGPIDPKAIEDPDDPKCPFCQHTLPTVPDPPPPPPAPNFTISFDPTITTTGSGSKVGAIVGVVIALIAVGGVIIGIVAAASSGSKVSKALGALGHISGNSLHPDGTPVPVSTAAGQTDFYVVARGSASDETETLRRVDGMHNRVVWSGAGLDQLNDGTPIIVAGTNQVFAVFNSTVVAMDGATGKQQWQGSLSNSLASPCDGDCAAIVGSRLVTLSKDGVLQAMDTASGVQKWSKRLASTPRWLKTAGASVVTDDDTSNPGSGKSVLVFDAATGAEHAITPVCPSNPDFGDEGAKPNDEADFFVSPDGSAVTVVTADSFGCAARYRLADGGVVWQTPVFPDPSPIPVTFNAGSTAQLGETIVWTNDNQGNQIFALNATNGQIRQLLGGARDDIEMVGGVGNTLVITDAPSYDSNKPSIVGLDLTTGKQLWHVATLVVKSGDDQGVIIAGSTPLAFGCNDSASQCKVEAINPQTGTIAGTSVVGATPAQFDEIKATSTPAGLLAAVGWEHIVEFTPATAAVLWKWPG